MGYRIFKVFKHSNNVLFIIKIYKIVGWGSNIDNSKYWIAANTFS